jgi:alkylation response protein AidB-like acyl-CoA dehydrogenase
MKLEPQGDQQIVAETFGRFFDEHSSMARVRAAMPLGFDRSLWKSLADMGALTMRVDAKPSGADLGLLDAALVMEQAGRTLASGPLAEAIVAARLLAEIGGEEGVDWLRRIADGSAVVTVALRDVALAERQQIAGGSVADAVLYLKDDGVWLHRTSAADRIPVANHASTSMSEMSLAGQGIVLARGAAARAAFLAGIEEWKLLIAAALSGLSREALKLAAAYACERIQFGQPIGAYQAISHPLADSIVDTDAAQLMVWRAICSLAHGEVNAGSRVSLAFWWAVRTASDSTTRALHTFGGYGLTLEYDIHLFHLRARAWPLMLGDPADMLAEAGRRLWCDEKTPFPPVGDVSIDFDLGSAADDLAAETREFFRVHLTPELKAKAHFSFSGHDPGLHKELAGAKLLYPAWPREWGGREADPYANFAALREWDRAEWTAHAQSTTNMIGQILMLFGSPEVKNAILPAIAAGEKICSLGFSEPSSGSDVFAAKTSATRDGDQWLIEGQKMFTSGANVAHYVLLLARTDKGAQKHRGLTMFLVPLDALGVAIQPIRTFQDEPTNITFYSGVRLPDAYRLGPVDGGIQVMVASLKLEQGGGGFFYPHARLLEAAVEWARTTRRGNRRVIDDEHVQRRLARVACHVAASEVIVFRSLWAAAEGRSGPFGPMSKLFSSEKFLLDSNDVLELAAPESLTKTSGPLAFINQCSRHASATTIYGGTSEVHRSMVAEHALGLPRTRAAG